MAHYTGLQYDISSLSELQIAAVKHIRFLEAVLLDKRIFAANGTEQEFRATITNENILLPAKSRRATDKVPLAPEEQTEVEHLRKFADEALGYYKEFLKGYGNWRKGSSAHDYIDRIEFDEEGRKLEIVTNPQSLVGSALSMWSNVRGLYSATSESENSDEPEMGFHTRRAAKSFPRLKSVRFEPGHNEKDGRPIKSSFSLHNNGSLNYMPISEDIATMPKRLLSENPRMVNLMEDINFIGLCTDIGLHSAKYDMMLLLANPNSHHRLSEGRLDRHHVDALKSAIYMHEDGKNSRMEFRMTDSSTDPFMSVLQVAAVLCKGVSVAESGISEEQDYVARLAANAKQYCGKKKISVNPYAESETGSLLESPEHDGVYVRNYFKGMIANFEEKSVVLQVLRQELEENPVIAERFGVSEESIDNFAANAVKWAEANRDNIAQMDTVRRSSRF